MGDASGAPDPYTEFESELATNELLNIDRILELHEQTPDVPIEGSTRLVRRPRVPAPYEDIEDPALTLRREALLKQAAGVLERAPTDIPSLWTEAITAILYHSMFMATCEAPCQEGTDAVIRWYPDYDRENTPRKLLTRYMGEENHDWPPLLLEDLEFGERLLEQIKSLKVVEARAALAWLTGPKAWDLVRAGMLEVERRLRVMGDDIVMKPDHAAQQSVVGMVVKLDEARFWLQETKVLLDQMSGGEGTGESGAADLNERLNSDLSSDDDAKTAISDAEEDHARAEDD